MSSNLAPSRFDGPWMLLSEQPEIGQRRWIRPDADDPNKWHVKTESWAPSLIAETNAEMLKASQGQRFGDGKVVARIPLADLYGPKLGPAFKAGDQPYIRKFLNDPDNRHMRTFEGAI
jgi:hypothetical protein